MKTIFRLKVVCIFVLQLIIMWFLGACQEPPPPKKVEIVRVPEMLNPKTGEIIASAISYAQEHSGKVDDSIRLQEMDMVADAYPGEEAKRLWSEERRWMPRADSMIAFVRESEKYGLFPEDYHAEDLISLREKLKDSAAMADAALWARGELMLTDAFVHICRHLKLGRLNRDSVTLRKDSILSSSEVKSLMKRARDGESFTQIFQELEPLHAGYHALKEALPVFLSSMNRTKYTYVLWPKKDTASYVKELQSRLFEDGYITFNTHQADSLSLSDAIRKAQLARGLTVDGKAGPQLIGSLNNTDPEKFIRIAINMDRYKMLADSMPPRFVWVNLPAFRMQLIDSGIVTLESKVIVGQPKTRSPELTSSIYNVVTMPQWTVPYSIIFGEMLPKIQKSTKYLLKENLMVVDRFDSIIDPDSVNWSKLSKTHFPYLLKQRQGDDNALGVIKFNFRNKYDVYLHDTNARSMFSRQNRALSHGCIRVQKWDSLVQILASTDSLKHHPDSISAWIANGQKKSVNLREKTPIYIRYFTAEAMDGEIRFFDDIYSDDKLLRNRHFGNKW